MGLRTPGERTKTGKNPGICTDSRSSTTTRSEPLCARNSIMAGSPRTRLASRIAVQETLAAIDLHVPVAADLRARERARCIVPDLVLPSDGEETCRATG